jgi:hypothetical protein
MRAPWDVDQQTTIWINVMNGVGDHGSFLRRFGAAFTAADYVNKRLLEKCSLNFIDRYHLDGDKYHEVGL